MNNNYALVLAGGGAKCSYQIGAWKALKELGIKIDMISAVSMGAINGAFFCVDDYDGAVNMWRSIEPKYSMKVADLLPNQEYLLNIKNWKMLAQDIVKNKGFDLSLTHDFLAKYIDEDKIRNSDIPFSILITDRKNKLIPNQVFAKDIPKGKMAQYILSSSNFLCSRDLCPEGEKFVDGGLHDNLPVNLLRQNGYNKVIILDTSEFKGFHHNLNLNNGEFIYIRPHNIEDLGKTFAFEKNHLEDRLMYGYLDTKKAFSLLLGKFFYFEPEVFRNMLNKYGFDTIDKLEDIAHYLKIDRLKIYSEEEFFKKLKNAFDQYSLTKTSEKIGVTDAYLVSKYIIINKLKGVSYKKAVEFLINYDFEK